MIAPEEALSGYPTHPDPGTYDGCEIEVLSPEYLQELEEAELVQSLIEVELSGFGRVIAAESDRVGSLIAHSTHRIATDSNKETYYFGDRLGPYEEIADRWFEICLSKDDQDLIPRIYQLIEWWELYFGQYHDRPDTASTHSIIQVLDQHFCPSDSDKKTRLSPDFVERMTDWPKTQLGYDENYSNSIQLSDEYLRQIKRIFTMFEVFRRKVIQLEAAHDVETRSIENYVRTETVESWDNPSQRLFLFGNEHGPYQHVVGNWFDICLSDEAQELLSEVHLLSEAWEESLLSDPDLYTQNQSVKPSYDDVSFIERLIKKAIRPATLQRQSNPLEPPTIHPEWVPRGKYYID
jgi:hypothetical protein